MATLGTFVFLWHWNDFLWPLVAQQSPEHYVLTVGLNSLQSETVSLATLMATAVVTFIPALLVFIFLQRYFVRGVMMSGIKSTPTKRHLAAADQRHRSQHPTRRHLAAPDQAPSRAAPADARR